MTLAKICCASITPKCPTTSSRGGNKKRGGLTATGTLVIEADPNLQIVDMGTAALSESQKAFREAWLGSKVK